MVDHRWQYDAGAYLWRCTPPPGFCAIPIGCHGCGATVTHKEYEALRDLGLDLHATLNQVASEKASG